MDSEIECSYLVFLIDQLALLFLDATNDDEETEVPTGDAPPAALSMPLLDDGIETDPPTSPVAGPSGIARRNCVEDDSPSGEAV